MSRAFHLLAGYLVAGTLLLFQASVAGSPAMPAFRIIERYCSFQILPATASLYCVDTVVVRRRSNEAGVLELELPNVFDVRGAEINGRQVQFKRGNGTLKFDRIPADSVFTLATWYNGDIIGQSDMVKIDRDRCVLREEVILPSGEESLRKARVTMTVPRAWYALTSGRLVSRAENGDSATFVWQTDTPVENISWFVAGLYKRYDFNGPVPVSVSLFPSDSTTSPDTLAALASRVLSFYSKSFSAYRFPKLEIVEVGNWVAGRNALAVASPSFVMVKQAAFETPDEFNKAATILPHEIAHQWWPLTAYIDLSDAALLAEGMCEYSARLFHESEGRLNPRDSLGRHPLLRPLLAKTIAGNDIPLRQRAALRNVQTHYLRSAYVHHMLRQVMGDSLFRELYRQYAGSHIDNPARQEDFQHLAEQLTGKNLQWFFRQWTEQTAIPRLKIYRATAAKTPIGWKTSGRVRILGYEKFTAFADVAVVAKGDTGRARVWLGQPLPQNVTDTIGSGSYQNDVQFDVFTKTEPQLALLDPDGNSLRVSKIPPRLSDLRDPGKGLMIVGTLGNAANLLEQARRDSEQMELGGWEMSIITDRQATLQSLQREDVFLYGSSAENSVAADNASKFSYRVGNDTAFIGAQAVSDSSLTLMQAIDNPYFPNGLMVWIARLSPKADSPLLPYDGSWVLLRGTETISSGSWEINEEDASVAVRK